LSDARCAPSSHLSSNLRSSVCRCLLFYCTGTAKMYTLSLHDALPIYQCLDVFIKQFLFILQRNSEDVTDRFDVFLDCFKTICNVDRKSTRLNSSHVSISYAVFCLQIKTPIRS